MTIGTGAPATTSTPVSTGADPFDVLVALDYYAPYVSGLTEHARIVAEGLAARGWRVAVACAAHRGGLPSYEVIGGVHVHRARSLGSVGRALVAPGLPGLVRRLARRSGVVHLHTPMVEASLARWLTAGRPLVTTYHIDAFLPGDGLDRWAMRAADSSARRAMRASAAVVTNSDDQAFGSRLWPTIRTTNHVPIASPCAAHRGRPGFRRSGALHVGFAGRITADKGLPSLIEAFARIPDPDARLLIAGDFATVAGGSNLPLLRAQADRDPRVEFLGLLRGEEMADFYASIDVFALPSVSESFGIVQVEAMLAGVPSVTTDIPGGRHPVEATGFGRLVPVGAVDRLAEALVELHGVDADARAEGSRRARELFSVDGALDRYEELLRRLGAGSGGASGGG